MRFNREQDLLLMEIIAKKLGFRVKGNLYSPLLVLKGEDAFYINLVRNVEDSYNHECYGIYNLADSVFGVKARLEDYFEHPLMPTHEEIELFKLEEGIDLSILLDVVSVEDLLEIS